MLTTMRIHAESRMIHRLLELVAVMVFLAVVLAARVSGQEAEPAPPIRPRAIAAEIHSQAIPIPAWPFTGSIDEPDPLGTANVTPETIVALWIVMEHHRSGEYSEADIVWSQLDLPNEAKVWREVGRAMCALMEGHPADAELRLVTAAQSSIDHPVLHYVQAIANLALADRASQWADAKGPRVFRLASLRAAAVPHHPRSTYLLRASHHFHAAIRTSRELMLDEPLVNSQSREATTAAYSLGDHQASVMPTRVPTVAEYLEAIGCDQFVARSHLGLAYLNIESGMLDQAEGYLIRAAELGLEVQDAWLKLGAEYEREERPDAATRAYLRAVGNGPSVIKPMRKAFGSLRNMFR